MSATDPFDSRSTLTYAGGETTWYKLDALSGIGDIGRMPVTVKILLENVLRNVSLGEPGFEADAVEALAAWKPGVDTSGELPFLPARVLLQDFTGVPAVVDLAAMRSAMQRLGGDPAKVNPLLPADLVIDHSVQIDYFGTLNAYMQNVDMEYQRNRERYTLLRWAQHAFDGMSIVPPGTGICHQVNLEFLSKVVQTREVRGQQVAFPDTCVGTDSHTPMVNGLGVLAWGVGGIEAEGAMLGQPIYMLPPKVVGVRLVGELPQGATATDLVLTITQMLRAHGVVGRFVEYCGPGVSKLSVADRATIGNMSPEYGATCGLFPVDNETLRYLRMTGRSDETIDLVERYSKEQGLFHTPDMSEPEFDEVLELDLGTVEPSVAGPRRPQDRVSLSGVKQALLDTFGEQMHPDLKGAALQKAAQSAAVAETFPASDPMPSQEERPGGTAVSAQQVLEREMPDPASLPMPGEPTIPFTSNGSIVSNEDSTEEVQISEDEVATIDHGSVVIAAITSCTNTSNPSVMLAAGLLAKNAVERGLRTKPYVKTSLAPGSRAVADYYENAGLMPYLEALGFHIVGYGCTTCIGNSGPLIPAVGEAVDDGNLVVAAALSGNRNFEGRIHQQVRASFLMSPPLVIAFALAGSVNVDLSSDPLGHDPHGDPVYLRDIWPTMEQVQEVVTQAVTADVFSTSYASVFDGDDTWRSLEVPEGQLYTWDMDSTYIQEPPYFENLQMTPPDPQDIQGARVLLKLGDSITTDHISPAGSIQPSSPAGRYLTNNDVSLFDFNSYGARRGNHEVMARGTFANIRLKNELTPEKEGNWSVYQPTGEEISVFEASYLYEQDGTPLIVLAGKEYGSGSSRDWAAKGPMLLGIKAVIAESYERIHRSNLVMMGVLPLQFADGEGRESLGLDGTETFDIIGIADGLTPGQTLPVTFTRGDGTTGNFNVRVRIDTPVEWDYYRHGGILPMVLRRLAEPEA